MSKKQETVQKDSKGRHLRREETQRKNGRYCFKYVDAKGRTRCAYSWTLTTRNLTPKGKKTGSCLRELEKEIQRDLFDNVAPDDMTVYELALRYNETKTAVKQSSRAGYKTVLNYLARDEFGSRRISDVTSFEAKRWLIDLQNVHGKRCGSIRTIRGVLKPAFQMAEENDLIRRNPFNFEPAAVLVNGMVAREALTPKRPLLPRDPYSQAGAQVPRFRGERQALPALLRRPLHPLEYRALHFRVLRSHDE